MSNSQQFDEPVAPVLRAAPPQHASFYVCTPVLLEQRERLVREGYQFVGKRRVRPNDQCGCSSGRKFKNCCESNIVRLAGATWFKPGARADTRRML